MSITYVFFALNEINPHPSKNKIFAFTKPASCRFCLSEQDNIWNEDLTDFTECVQPFAVPERATKIIIIIMIIIYIYLVSLFP